MGADGHVRIEISGDSTPLEKDLQHAEKECSDALSEISKESQKTTKALEDTGDAAKAVGDSRVTGGLEDVADALANVGDNAGDAGKGVEDTGKKAESVWKKLEGMSKSAADLQDALANTVKQSAATIGKTFAVVGAGVTAVGTATAGVLVNLGNGYNKAVNQIGAATGATGKELKQLGQIAQNVYSHNFGDSLEDVADGIAVVRQNTQLMGEELQAATEAGFALRDTFGYELSESARTAGALMKNFGIDANKAYNIIATGAQKGADQNGDLLDTLNEYSTQYAALGLSADQFVNGLIAGAEAGVFSIDKVGDAVKEFNIRAKDGSKSTTSAFATLGLKASTTMQAFAKGGDTAQKAFFEVIKALEAMKDPVQKNQTAVALFGTQYEDLEKTVLPVLASMEDASKTTYDALGEINEIKYEDLGSALQGLKRTIEGGLIPAAGKIASGPMMTAMQELQKMANDLAKSIKAGEYDSVFEGIADGITGVVKALPKVRDGIQKIAPVVSNIASVATGFLSAAVENIDLVVAAIAGIGTAIAVLKILTFIGDVIKAVQALGAAFTLSTGPIGLAVLAISGVVAAIAQYVALSDDAEQAAYDSMEATRALREESEKLTAEYEQNREARLKSAETAEAETATAELYAGKLEALAKKEHKSADEKAKMAHYVDILNDKLPDLNLQYDAEKDKLSENTDEIWKNIEARQAQAKVEAYNSNYKAAIEERVNLEKELDEAKKVHTENLKAQQRAQNQVDATVKKSSEGWVTYELRLKDAKDNLAKATEATNQSKAALDDIQKSYNAAGQEAEYWGDKATETLDAQALKEGLAQMQQVAKDGGVKIPKSVSEGVASGRYQVAQSVGELQNLIAFDQAVQKADLQGVAIPQALSAGVNSGQISVADAIQRLKDIAKFDGIARNAGLSGNKATQKLRDSIANGSVSVSEAANRVAAAVKFDKAAEAANLSGNKTIRKLRDSMLSGEMTIAAAAEQIADICVSNMAPEGVDADGEKVMNELASGYKNGGAIAERAAKSVSDGSLDELRVAASQSDGVGYNVSDGFAGGITRGKWKAIDAIIDLVDDTIAAGKKEAGIESPSKVMRDQVGIHMAGGMAAGMRKGIPQVASAAADMVDDAVDAANAATAKAKIDTSKLTLSPAEAQAAIAANIDSMSAQAKLAVQYEMDRRAASVAVQAAAVPTYNDSQVVGLLNQLLSETKAGKVIRVNQRELGRTVREWNQRMDTVTGGK